MRWGGGAEMRNAYRIS